MKTHHIKAMRFAQHKNEETVIVTHYNIPAKTAQKALFYVKNLRVKNSIKLKDLKLNLLQYYSIVESKCLY